MQALQKPFSQLQPWDVIEIYGVTKFSKKAVVIAPPRVEGDRALVKFVPLSPTQRYLNSKKVQSAWFAGETQVQERVELKTPSQYWGDKILSVLGPEMSPKSPHEIYCLLSDLGETPVLARIKDACKGLALIKALRTRGEKKIPKYRLPLQQVAGLPVAFMSGTRSEMLGWVEQWKQHQQSDRPFAVVRLINGQTVAGSEENLDPVDHPIFLDGIIKIRDGRLEEAPVLLEQEIFAEFQKDWRNSHFAQGSLHRDLVKRVAIALGLAFEYDNIHNWQLFNPLRDQVLSYLHQYYPGWKYGVNAQRIWNKI